MKAVTFLSLILFNFSVFATSDCSLHPEILDSEGKMIITNTYITHSSNSSLKNCF